MVAAVAPSAAAELTVIVLTDADRSAADIAACMLYGVLTGVLLAAGKALVHARLALALVVLRLVRAAFTEYFRRMLLAVAGIVAALKDILMRALLRAFQLPSAFRAGIVIAAVEGDALRDSKALAAHGALDLRGDLRLGAVCGL